MAENKQNSENKGAAGNDQATADNASTGKNAAKKSDAATANAADDSVKDTLGKAKDAAGEAVSQAAGKAQEKATEIAGGQKNNLAAGISTIAESVRNIGENLQSGDGEKNQIVAFAGQYGNTLAERIDRFSHYVEDKDFGEIARDTERFARRNPALFVGGAFALGILAARIFKSSGRKKFNGSRLLENFSGDAAPENAPVQAS